MQKETASETAAEKADSRSRHSLEESNQRHLRPRWLRYGVAIVAVAVGLGLRYALTPVIGRTELPFTVFFLSVVATAAFGGQRPALVATFLAALCARWFFLQPFQSLSIPSWNIFVGLVTFVAVSLFIGIALERLHREKNLVATTLRSIGDAVMVTDARGCLTFLNPEAERLTGWKLSDARGKDLPEIFKIINEVTRQPSEDPAAKVLRLGKVVGLANHTTLIAKDGTETPIDDSAAPVRDLSGKIIGTVLVFRDITARRAAERAALQLASIVENADEGIVGKDLNGTVTSWNKSAERIFGYPASEMVGQSIRILIPTERQHEEDKILSMLQRGERIEHFETVRKTKDGREIQVLVSSSPIKDREGRIVGASKIVHDITHRKAMEAELRRAHAELEDYARNLETAVEERTTNLQSTIAELESVSYSLSHDMRAPLRTIQSFSQIVIAEAGEKLGALEKDLLQKSINAASRLDRLIQDVLTYSRVGRERIELKTLDVEQLVEQIVHERPDLQQPKAEIKIETPLQPVRGHEAYLSQCITNLLDNAVKFVAPGQRPRVRIWSEGRNGTARIWFEDNGIGIPPEARERVFGLFQRLHNQSDYPGTGVGLTIVRKAVERMGGDVGVESEPGKGSKFWVQLPKGEQR